MKGTPLEPDAYASAVLESVPEIGEIAELDSEIVANLDSSDMGPIQWVDLINRIEAAKDECDGVVIVHGTDTMAYTASALAFGLDPLDMPVILTGAQRPLAALRTDARRNLADAVDLATREICEVGICFDGLLLRGCCSMKSNVREYRAFDSPGVEPLARLGVDVSFSESMRKSAGPLQTHPMFDERVMLVHVTPALSPELLRHTLSASRDQLRGIVLGAFGLGTVPRQTHALAPVIADAVDDGLEVLVVTQSAGRVELGLYQNSRPLEAAGAIAGGAMRYEAATVKLMHALARFEDRDERRDYLKRNVAGEMG